MEVPASQLYRFSAGKSFLIYAMGSWDRVPFVPRAFDTLRRRAAAPTNISVRPVWGSKPGFLALPALDGWIPAVAPFGSGLIRPAIEVVVQLVLAGIPDPALYGKTRHINAVSVPKKVNGLPRILCLGSGTRHVALAVAESVLRGTADFGIRDASVAGHAHVNKCHRGKRNNGKGNRDSLCGVHDSRLLSIGKGLVIFRRLPVGTLSSGSALPQSTPSKNRK
jgi:hypothetical protein